ncbi:methyl-accepting chemotaxis protein [Rhodobacteraceae bacterium D3-12]|nr:methyl-accepting chemotaxis protein [Rhodobacteraceae bacterium D3-12]
MTTMFSRERLFRFGGLFGALNLQTKLSVIITIGFGVTMAVIAYVQISHGERTSKSIVRQADLVIVDLIANQLSGPVQLRDKAQVKVVSGLLLRDDVAALYTSVTHVDGEIMASFTSPDFDGAAYGHALSSLVGAVQNGGGAQSVYIGTSIVAAAPVFASGGVTQIGTLAIIVDHTQGIATITWRIWNGLLLGAAVGFVGLALIGLGIRTMVVRPCNAFITAMQAISRRDFGAEIPGRNRKDEMGIMAEHLAMFRDVLSREQREQAAREQEAMTRQRLYARLSDGLSDLAAGNLDREIDIDDFADMTEEHTDICRNFNSVMADLRAILSTVTNTAETVRGRSHEISKVARDQAKRSEAQAATLEESTAAIEELNTSVQRTASHAANAAEQIRRNRLQAEAGGDVVEQTTEAMKKIEDSSQQITAIIGVIDDIAFQTNLLALNAGVEAARAGDAGRGFAVVASEVRALAQRASESANEIKSLILNSSEHVAEGSQLAHQAGAALKDIIQGVSHVSEVVSHIATGSREQAENLAEIKDGIDDLDRVTQQNAAVIEETSAASRALKEEAEHMTHALRVFTFTPDDPQAALARQANVGGSGQGSWELPPKNHSAADLSAAGSDQSSAPKQVAAGVRSGTNTLDVASDNDCWDEF